MSTDLHPDAPRAAAIPTPTAPVAAPPVAGGAGDPESFGPRARRRLLASLAMVWVALAANYQGLGQVLLPNQVRALDPAHKISNLALVTTVSVIFTFVAQPVVGSFSDRTRSRLGRRAPWIIAGAAVAAAFLCFLGGVHSLLLITVFWVVIQLSLNVLQGPLSATVADRFPRRARGAASAIVGIGTMVGSTAGILVAGAFAERLGVGYAVFGIAIIVAAVVFVVANRDHDSIALEREPFRWRAFFAGFWISPRRHPDFALAFVGRLLFGLGYSIYSVYQLYTLTDYIRLSPATANRQIGVLGTALLAGILVTVLLGGWLSDRLGRRKVFIYLASVFMGAGLVVPLVSPTLGGMYVLSFLLGMGFGLYLSADVALMTEVLPDSGGSAAKDLGILNIANNVPSALAPGIAALLIDYFGGYPALFVFGVVAVVAAAVAIVPIKSVR
jgi:MFS family permease